MYIFFDKKNVSRRHQYWCTKIYLVYFFSDLDTTPEILYLPFFPIIKLLFWAFPIRNHLTLILSTFILLFHSDIWISKFYLNSFPFQWLSLLIVSNKWHQFRQSKWYFWYLCLTQSICLNKSPLWMEHKWCSLNCVEDSLWFRLLSQAKLVINLWTDS